MQHLWMAVDIDVHSNGKVLSLAERLDVSPDEAVGIMVRLWAHAMRDSDRTGKLRHTSPTIFAEIFRKPRDKAQDILALLVELELLDDADGAYFVHGWEERQAAWYAYQEKRVYNKKYKQEKKSEAKSSMLEGSFQMEFNPQPDQTLPDPTAPHPTPPHSRGGASSPPADTALSGGPPSKKPREWGDGTLIDDIYGLYNELCPSLPKVVQRTPARRNAVLFALKHKGLSAIHDAFIKAESTPFLKGENERGWKADFDWLLKGDNLEHVLEGRYDCSENCTADPDMDRLFKNRNTYTKEQFDAMKANIFDLKDL